MTNVATSITPTARSTVASNHASIRRGVLPLAGVVIVIVATAHGIADPMMSRAATIAGVCLVLWLSELIPLYATTLLLWVAIVLWLAPLDPSFAMPRVLAVATNPVMALFFGGFVLSV